MEEEEEAFPLFEMAELCCFIGGFDLSGNAEVRSYLMALCQIKLFKFMEIIDRIIHKRRLSGKQFGVYHFMIYYAKDERRNLKFRDNSIFLVSLQVALIIIS